MRRILSMPNITRNKKTAATHPKSWFAASENRTWLVLIGLTLFTTIIAETGTLTWASVALISLIVIIKGRLIIREYMDMKTAHPALYWSLIIYMALFSTAMLVSFASFQP